METLGQVSRLYPERPRGDNLRNLPNQPACYRQNENVVLVGYAEGGGEGATAISLADQVKISGGLTEFQGLGLVLDADTKTAADRFASVMKKLKRELPGAALPTAPGQVIPGPPRFGVLVNPDNASTGTVEDALLAGSHRVYPNVTKAAQTFVNTYWKDPDLQNTKRSAPDRPASPKKATLNALGNLLRPGASLSVPIQFSEWVSDATLAIPAQRTASEFLDALLPHP